MWSSMPKLVVAQNDNFKFHGSLIFEKVMKEVR